MLKLLRKYQTVMLVVFGVFLMIAFLMPGAIQRFGQNSKGRVEADLGNKPIRSLDFQFAQQEIRVLGNLAPQFVGPGGILGFGEDRVDDAHWILLTKAAQDAGMIGEVGDGRSWVPELMQLMAVQIAQANAFQQYGQLANQIWTNPVFDQTRQQMIDDVYFNQLLPNQDQLLLNRAREAGLTLDETDTALAKLRGIFRLIVTHNQMARLSRPRSENESKSVGDQAIADALFLSSSLVESEIVEPTEEQLQAHFEQFRDTRAFEGEFGIGYLMPSRIKLEVLKLDRQAIADAALLDPVAVNRRWLRNKDLFGEDFIIAKPDVEKQLRNEFADEILRKADRHIKAFTFRARDTLELDGDFYVIPEDWDASRPTLEKAANYVIEQVEKEIHADGNTAFVMPRPVVTVLAGNWLTFSDLQAEESIRTAAVAIANQRVSIAQLVFAVHEFDPPTEISGFQVGLPAVGLVATDSSSNHYFFIVLAAQDESPAASLDEVREKATTDYTSLAAYELLVSRLDEYKQLAITDGLQAVSDLFATEPEADPLETDAEVDPLDAEADPDSLAANTTDPATDPAPESPAPDTTQSQPDPLAANIAGPQPELADDDADDNSEPLDADAAGVPGPPVQENLIVGDPAAVAGLPGEANDELFREAVLELASSMDPFTLPDDIDPANATVAVPLPARLGIELGRIRLPRPLTIEYYRTIHFRAGQSLIGTELRDAMQEASNPYSFENLAARYAWTFRNDSDNSGGTAQQQNEAGQDETDPAVDEADSATGDNDPESGETDPVAGGQG